MKLLVDSRITDRGIPVPAAILVHNIEDPLRYTASLIPRDQAGHGLVFDAASRVRRPEQASIRLHSFDQYEPVPCELKFIMADETLPLKYGERRKTPSNTISTGALIYGVQTLDCRSTFEIITIFGSHITDMSAFRIRRTTHAVLISVFGAADPSNTLIAQSLVELMSANTTVTDVEACDTWILDRRRPS